MYISPRKQKTYTILAIVTLLSIPLGIFGFRFYQDWRTRATASPTPTDVRISDLTESGVVISWVTSDTAATGWIKYGKDSTLKSDSQVMQDLRDVNSGQSEKRKTHYVSIGSLNPSEKYYFVIGSGAQEYKDTGGNPFEFTTASSGSSDTPSSPNPVYGTITNGENQEAIVYITLGGSGERSSPVSALTNDMGNFEVDLSHVRTSTLSGLYSFTDSTDMNIYAQGADKGGAIVETTVGVTEDIEITMDESVPTTQIFPDSSEVDVDDNDGDSQTPDTPDTNDNDYPISDDIVLTPMGNYEVISQSDDIEGVEISNVTENTFTVIWESDDKEEGYVKYGLTSTSLTQQAIDDRDSLSSKGKYYMHHVTLEDLEPEKTYYFKIYSGGISYDDEGYAYSQSTPATESTPPTSYTIVGVVTGTAKADSVITAQIETSSAKSALLSVVSDAEGDWVIDLGTVRSLDYSSYFDYEVSDTILVNGIAAGDSKESSHIISEVEGEVLGLELNINKSDSAIAELPETAINGIAAVSITISVMLIIYGVVLLGNYYNDERKYQWEKEFIKRIDE